MAEDAHWGILFFHYDWFAAFRTDVVRHVRFDPFIHHYKSDCGARMTHAQQDNLSLITNEHPVHAWRLALESTTHASKIHASTGAVKRGAALVRLKEVLSLRGWVWTKEPGPMLCHGLWS